MIADYDLTPHPSPTIPDNPPPREGALVNLPFVVEPPDLVLVEVLEALPGRPISGERMVRPDGTISLGWYGDIQVRGLTVPQIKVAIIKHLTRFLNDADLGLAVSDAGESEIPQPERLPIPPLPENANPFDRDEAPKPIKKSSSATRAQPRTGKSDVRPAPLHVAGRRKPVRFIPVRGTRQEPAAAPESPKPPAQINIPAGATGRITITIDLGGPARPAVEPGQIPVPAIEPEAPGTEESWRLVPPEESQRVFVDVTAYNTMNYYVQGDVATTGRFPYTGNETVFDILQFAGGLLSSADPKQITLVRPERNGKPAKVYKVDLEAIQQRGEVATNYQIFPGDRLFVGRNEVVKKTVEIDRLNAPISTMTGMMLQEAFMLRALQMVSIDHRDELLKEYVDFWAKELSRSGGVKFDEQTLRDAFIRKMKLIPAPVPANPSR
jgi:protein involved in polysaccharide export with SLBB domain